MGIYHEYVSRNMTPQVLEAERKKYLAEIGRLRNCEVFIYAARLTALPMQVPVMVLYEDILPFADMLEGLKGKRIAVILETPGGMGEVGRQMVEMLHDRFEYVEFIVPGMAKSTGTIMVLGGHEILMGPGSALGPIDAQLTQDNKTYSADALIEGLDRIKREIADANGQLNPIYIPILQKISPGEIQNAINALAFAQQTVTEWLIRYKFENWKIHKSSGKAVTDDEKRARAAEISNALSSQGRWKTHGRSLRIPHLRDMHLKITDFSEDKKLYDAIQRYHVLLRMTFDSGNAFKIFETEAAVFARRFNIAPAGLPNGGLPTGQPVSIRLEVPCSTCQTVTPVQLDFDLGMPHQPGQVRYPDSGVLKCPKCANILQLGPIRAGIEAQIGRPALTPQPKD